MTLKDYLNQEKPTRGNIVDLAPGEFKKVYKYKESDKIITKVRINHYPEYEYYLIGDGGVLYTDCSFKKASCFFISSTVSLN